MTVNPLFSTLPAEIIHHILSFLSPKELEVSRRACLIFSAIVRESQFLMEQISRSFQEDACLFLWKKVELLSHEEKIDVHLLGSLATLRAKYGKADEALAPMKEISKEMRVQIVKKIVNDLCSERLFDRAEEMIKTSGVPQKKKNSLFELIAIEKAKAGLIDESKAIAMNAIGGVWGRDCLNRIGQACLQRGDFVAAEELAESDPGLTLIRAHLLAAKANRVKEEEIEKLSELEVKALALPNPSERSLIYVAIMMRYGKSGNLGQVAALMLKLDTMERCFRLREALVVAVKNGFFAEVEDFLYRDELIVYQGQDVIATIPVGELMGMLEEAFQEHLVLEELALSAIKRGDHKQAKEFAIGLKDRHSLSIVLSEMFPLIEDEEKVNEINRLLAEHAPSFKSYVLRVLSENSEGEGYNEILKNISDLASRYNEDSIHLDRALVLALRKENSKAAGEEISFIKEQTSLEAAYLELIKSQISQGFIEAAKETSTFLGKGFKYDEGLSMIIIEQINKGLFEEAKKTLLPLSETYKFSCSFQMQQIAASELEVGHFYQAKKTIQSISEPVYRKRAFADFVDHALRLVQKFN